MEQNTFGFENEGNLTFCDCYMNSASITWFISPQIKEMSMSSAVCN